jgi:hypothetical protein
MAEIGFDQASKLADPAPPNDGHMGPYVEERSFEGEKATLTRQEEDDLATIARALARADE